MRALELLNYLGAIDDEGDLTPVSHIISPINRDPSLSDCFLMLILFLLIDWSHNVRVPIRSSASKDVGRRSSVQVS